MDSSLVSDQSWGETGVYSLIDSGCAFLLLTASH